MTTQPPIVISRLDANRLQALLEKMEDTPIPGMELLEDELGRATVVAPQEMPREVVTMNSTVRFRIEDSAREFTLKLVYPRDVDGAPEKVSILAPIGSAMIGLREGDSIEWPMPGGSTSTVTIVEVVDQPERRGDFAS